MLSPFLPHSANAVDAAIGGTGDVAPLPRVEEVEDLDGGPGYPVITGDYTGVPAWGRRPVQVGAPVAKPAPIFTKLDASIVEEELRRLGVEEDDGGAQHGGAAEAGDGNGGAQHGGTAGDRGAGTTQ